MPLHWTIDSRRGLFVATAVGIVDKADADRMIDVLVASNILGYRKLFDGTEGDTKMGAVDILALGVRMRELHAAGPMGPLAVVVPEDKYVLLSRVLGMLAAAKRPMRIFNDRRKALQWLESSAVRASAPLPATVLDGAVPEGDEGATPSGEGLPPS
jgi:hypothetical protein